MRTAVLVLWDVATDEAIILGADGLRITLPNRDVARAWLDDHQYAPPSHVDEERETRRTLAGVWYAQGAAA